MRGNKAKPFLIAKQGKHLAAERVIIYEVIAIVIIIVIIWLNEAIDLPNLFLGAPSTPMNWRESLFESVLIVILGLIIVYFTKRQFMAIKTLEGILPVCSSCKKIKDEDDNWHDFEAYIRDSSAADFSHAICPECARGLYPGIYKDETEK